MNIHSFFSREDLTNMQRKSSSKEPFEYVRQHKAKENKYEVRVAGCSIDKKLAADVWRGNDYLVRFGFAYHGKLGIGGKGWAVDEFIMLRDWDSFANYIDAAMSHYPEYEKDEFGQMCLW